MVFHLYVGVHEASVFNLEQHHHLNVATMFYLRFNRILLPNMVLCAFLNLVYLNYTQPFDRSLEGEKNGYKFCYIWSFLQLLFWAENICRNLL